MNRRAVLAATGAVAGGLAGCLGSAFSSQRSVTATDVATHYPLFPPTYYSISAEPVGDPDQQPTSFDALSPQSRLEVANGITRWTYVTDRSPHVLGESEPLTFVTYRDASFRVSVSVADSFAEPEHGPDSDPGWHDPVELAATVENSDLLVTLTNKLGISLPFHYFGRPYFGVLTAVNGSPALLSHDQYEENPSVRTAGLVRTGEDVESQTNSLSPGKSVQESYGLPDSLPPNRRCGWQSPSATTPSNCSATTRRL